MTANRSNPRENNERPAAGRTAPPDGVLGLLDDLAKADLTDIKVSELARRARLALRNAQAHHGFVARTDYDEACKAIEALIAIAPLPTARTLGGADVNTALDHAREVLARGVEIDKAGQAEPQIPIAEALSRPDSVWIVPQADPYLTDAVWTRLPADGTRPKALLFIAEKHYREAVKALQEALDLMHIGHRVPQTVLNPLRAAKRLLRQRAGRK